MYNKNVSKLRNEVNKMKYEFDGISTEQFNEQDKELFTEYYDGTLIEKDNFTVELDSKEVKLHLYIEHIDMSEYEDTDDQIISIGVVPAFESLSEKHQQDILGQFTEDDQEYFKNHTDELLQDSISYGFGITLRSETVKEDDVENKINSAIAVRHSVSGLIGFELDRYVNRIGNTGWDFLADYCEDQDLIKSAMARFKK
jgi:hypothetical protein